MSKDENMLALHIGVVFGDDIHTFTLIPRNWSKKKAGKPLRIRGKGYWLCSDFFWDYWTSREAWTES